MGYHSARKLFALAEGFMQGAAAHYGETLTITQHECMHHGGPRCMFRIEFH